MLRILKSVPGLMSPFGQRTPQGTQPTPGPRLDLPLPRVTRPAASAAPVPCGAAYSWASVHRLPVGWATHFLCLPVEVIASLG